MINEMDMFLCGALIRICLFLTGIRVQSDLQEFSGVRSPLEDSQRGQEQQQAGTLTDIWSQQCEYIRQSKYLMRNTPLCIYVYDVYIPLIVLCVLFRSQITKGFSDTHL